MRRLARSSQELEKQKKRKKQSGIYRAMWKSHVNTAIRGIKKIEAKLHKIHLSSKNRGQGYGYTALKSRLGDLAYLAETESYQIPNYDRKYIRKFENFDLEVFVNPKESYLPDCLLFITPTTDISLNTYKTFLENLNDKLPGLKVSSVEYTIDLFCNFLMENNILFSTIARTLYVPAQTKVSFPYGQEIDEQEIDEQKISYGGKKIQYNALCYNGERTKFYQRGKDEKKKFIRKNKKGKEEQGWKIEDLDRVRLEFTAKDRKKLRNCGIGDLDSFVKNPKFGEINLFRDKNRWRLEEFKSEKYPCPLEEGAFQEKYLALSVKLKNPSQEKTESQLLKPLKSNLDFAMQKFDVEWSGNYIIDGEKLIEIPY